MNPDNIPCNALIVGSTYSGKSRYLVNLSSTTFREKFHYIVLICATFIHNITYDGFAEDDKDLVTLTPIQDQIGDWLKLTSFASVETNTLIILDDCPTSRDVK